VISAQYVKRMGSLIEAENLLGSFFYSGMLGAFILAFFFRRVRRRGAFWGVLSGEDVIFATSNVSQTPPSVLVALCGGRGWEVRLRCERVRYMQASLVTERMSSSPTTDMLGQEEIN
jgi:hypothetical protein